MGKREGGNVTVRTRSLEIVHNIPSPYRLHLFRQLAALLARRRYRFRVHFMAPGHANRAHWTFRDGDVLGFEYRLWRDVGVSVRRKQWHLNPGMLGTLARSPPEVLIIGGPWDSLTGALASASARSPVRVAWVEGSPDNLGKSGGLAGVTKRFLLRRFTHVAVPGRRGVEYVRAITGVAAPRTVILPNIVDERRFSAGRDPDEVATARARMGVHGDDRVALWPARLVPEKGIPEFLSLLEANDLVGWQVVILGDGPLRPEIDRVVQARGLGAHVRIIPAWSYEEVPAAYRAADLFLLPSLADRNPLSVVEALHSGLPVLLSNRAGNFPEALEEGRNGWAFDPGRPDLSRTAIRAALRTTRAELAKMGQRSANIAAERWGSAACVGRFLDEVLPARSS